MNNLDLLRKYEPVIKYTQGEMFFPCAVDEYVKRCSLWIRDKQGNDQMLIPENQLTLETLEQFDQTPSGCVHYLRFVEEPLNGIEYQQWWLREERTPFHSPGRLARVGIASRILDSFFDISLLLRGTVPRGTAAEAERQYQQIKNIDNRNVYYGRVLRENGYIILHYLFFYAMNDWRSTFYGVNDHESDWEQVFVYLADSADMQPLWVACAAHDYNGDDLRRRWDDPTLEKAEGSHPIIYAGAGSHANYFLSGEYLTNVQLEVLKPLINLVDLGAHVWQERLGQGLSEAQEKQISALFNIPFIDYARGDGIAIGVGEKQSWSPILFTADMRWVDRYRGLWGLDTKDPLGGERAPAGPKYNRNGTMRLSWHNPLGWAGLHKVAPPQRAMERLQSHIETLKQELQNIRSEINTISRLLQALELEVRALRETEFLDALYQDRQEALEKSEDELDALYARQAEITETLDACQIHMQKLQQGDYGDPRAHLLNEHKPEPPLKQQSQLIELWAALSSGLLVLVFALTVIYDPGDILITSAFALSIFIIIEAMLRGRVTRVLLNITITMAVFTTLILVFEFIWLLIFIGLVAVSWILIAQNLRELRKD